MADAEAVPEAEAEADDVLVAGAAPLFIEAISRSRSSSSLAFFRFRFFPFSAADEQGAAAASAGLFTIDAPCQKSRGSTDSSKNTDPGGGNLIPVKKMPNRAALEPITRTQGGGAL